MRHICKLLLASVTFAFATVTVYAEDVKVIANQNVNSVSADDLKRVFLITKTSVEGGLHVEPVLVKGGAAHEAFLKEYVGRSDSALLAYYRGLMFTGKGNMPKIFENEAELIAYVAKTPGAIGYVSVDAPTTGVKVLEVK